jgi:hypothetical protein
MEKEEIKFKIELFRLSVIGLISVSGGTVGMINDGVINGASSFFISFGILISIGLIRYSYKLYKELNQ